MADFLMKEHPPVPEAPQQEQGTETLSPKEKVQVAESQPAVEQVAPPSVQETSPVLEQKAVETSPVLEKDPLTKRLESLLEEDLGELFNSLQPQEKQAFSKKGEETAKAIREILASPKINIRKVFNLIRNWLKLLPKVNKFFLEQEAKIKTDKIALISEEAKSVDELSLT